MKRVKVVHICVEGLHHYMYASAVTGTYLGQAQTSFASDIKTTLHREIYSDILRRNHETL